jgi:hypothetical protein
MEKKGSFHICDILLVHNDLFLLKEKPFVFYGQNLHV